MNKIEFIPFLLTEQADIFSVKVDDDMLSEFHKFLVLFKDSDDSFLKEDFEEILASLNEISQEGALESFFRPEGKFADRVCAIPLFIKPRNKSEHGTLRVFCIRISDRLLIVGGGGVKEAKTYEEQKDLSAHVALLQLIDKKLSEYEETGKDLSREIYNLTLYLNNDGNV